jgi:hypothetical protein
MPEAAQLKSRASSITGVPLLQFIHQMSQMGRQFGGFGAKVVLQPFADGTADRSAGSPIDLFAALVDSVRHRRFRWFVTVDRHGIKSPKPKLFRSLINCMPFG